MLVMANLASQDYWDSAYGKRELRYRAEAVEFVKTFARFLKRGGSCFEVGCYPGNFLIYLCREFGYVANGIDRTPHVTTRLRDHLRANGVAVGTLYQGDFLTFQTSERFDVVCSFGFIEHFEEFPTVIQRHIDLVAPGGTLILTCPNFRRFQFLLHWLFDRENLRHHVLASMDLRRWGEVLEQNGMTVLHQGYALTAGFWTEAPGDSLSGRLGRRLERLSAAIDARVEYPNRCTSPYMVCIAPKAVA